MLAAGKAATPLRPSFQERHPAQLRAEPCQPKNVPVSDLAVNANRDLRRPGAAEPGPGADASASQAPPSRGPATPLNAADDRHLSRLANG